MAAIPSILSKKQNHPSSQPCCPAADQSRCRGALCQPPGAWLRLETQPRRLTQAPLQLSRRPLELHRFLRADCAIDRVRGHGAEGDELAGEGGVGHVLVGLDDGCVVAELGVGGQFPLQGERGGVGAAARGVGEARGGGGGGRGGGNFQRGRGGGDGAGVDLREGVVLGGACGIFALPRGEPAFVVGVHGGGEGAQFAAAVAQRGFLILHGLRFFRQSGERGVEVASGESAHGERGDGR